MIPTLLIHILKCMVITSHLVRRNQLQSIMNQPPQLIEETQDNFDRLEDNNEAFMIETSGEILESGRFYSEQEAAAGQCQSDNTAFLAFQRGRSKAKHSAGKGRYSQRHNFNGDKLQYGSARKSRLSLDERCKSLQKVKERVHCSGCGQKGRWAGDPSCPKKNHSGGQ